MRISASERYNHGRTGDFFDRTIRRACLIGSLSAAMLAGTASLAATTDTDSDTDSEGAPELQGVVVTGSLLPPPPFSRARLQKPQKPLRLSRPTTSKTRASQPLSRR